MNQRLSPIAMKVSPPGIWKDGIKVAGDRCIVCGACSAVCPREALIALGMTLVIIPERCRPCGQAALVCPTGALTCPQDAQNRPSGSGHDKI